MTIQVADIPPFDRMSFFEVLLAEEPSLFPVAERSSSIRNLALARADGKKLREYLRMETARAVAGEPRGLGHHPGCGGEHSAAPHGGAVKTSEFLARFCSKGRYSEVAKGISERFPDDSDVQAFQDAAGLGDDDPQLASLVEIAARHPYSPMLFASWVKALGATAAYWSLGTIHQYVLAEVPPEYVGLLHKGVQTMHDVVIDAWKNNLAPDYVL